MKKILLLSLLLAASAALAQNVRYDAPFPSISSTTATPYLVANVPPNSPTLAVCTSPANQVPCTNYATTYDSLGNACANGAQDTPQPQPSACQATGDAEGNIGFWAPAGTYDYTVTVRNVSYGPFTVTLGSTATSNATAIQSVPVTSPITTTPGTDLVIDPTGTSFVSRTEYDVDSRSCGLPTDNGVTDSYQKLQDCVNNNPGKHIRLWKTAAPTSTCDYKISQSIFMLGSGQWIDGQGNGGSGSTLVRVCSSQIGVSGFVMTNQMCQGCKISNMILIGMEPYSRLNLAQMIPPYGISYPGIEWATVTATGTTATVNGTNEVWNNQTDLKTIQILGGGASSGTVSISTTANSYTATCTCTRAMIGKTVAIPGALGGATLYAHIIGITGTNPPVTGNAYLDQKPTSTVGPVTGSLGFDYYGTISSHSSGTSATISPAITTPVTAAYAYVGSTADAIRSISVGGRVDQMNIESWGRNGVNLAQDMYPVGLTGAASNLSDLTNVTNSLIRFNRGHGINCAGGDCNLNVFDDNNIQQNQFWGISDLGFLVNGIRNVDAAGNNGDCSTLPAPGCGGSTGMFTNTGGTWYDGVPYASATAPPIYHTDGTCTDSSTTLTLGSAGFVTGHADPVNGQIVKLTGCGTAGADLTTFITGFTSSTSVTVADAPSCGGACPAPAAAIVQIYSTVNITGAPFFDPSYLGNMVLLQQAGPDGQTLVTTMAIYYSTTKMGINAAPTNRSLTQARKMYFGTTSYVGRTRWQQAFQFTTGAITAGASVLTTTAANDLFVNPLMCNTNPVFRGPFVIKGAGPGGTDHITTCSTFTNSQQVTLTNPAATTVTAAEVWIGIDGGTYKFRGGFCNNCYEESDQEFAGAKFSTTVTASPAVANLPANPGGFGLQRYCAVANSYCLAAPLAIGNFLDAGNTINLFGGRNRQQGITFNFLQTLDSGAGQYTTIGASFGLSSALLWTHVIGGQTWLSTNATTLRDYIGPTQVISGNVHRFKGNSGGQQLFNILADGSFAFGFNASSLLGTTISPVGNTVARAIKTPDAAGTLCVTGSGSNPCQYKRAAGCATTASAGDVCTTTLTWTTAFADTNYTVSCTGQLVTSGVPVAGGLTAKSASAVDFRTVAGTAAAAQYTNVGCMAVHD